MWRGPDGKKPHEPSVVFQSFEYILFFHVQRFNMFTSDTSKNEQPSLSKNPPWIDAGHTATNKT